LAHILSIVGDWVNSNIVELLEQLTLVIIYLISQNELESYLGFWHSSEVEEALVIVDWDWYLAHLIETQSLSHTVEEQEPSIGKVHVQ